MTTPMTTARSLWKGLERASLPLFVFLALSGVLLWATGMLHFGAAGATGAEHAEAHADHAEHAEYAETAEDAGNAEHEDRAGHDHVAGDAAWCVEHGVPEAECVECNPQAAAGDAARKCEHRLPLLECDDCRYLAGAVAVDPELAERLLETAEAAPGAATRTLRFTGEVALDRTRVVEVPAAAGGRIVVVSAFLGDEVAPGDLLAVLHSADFGEAKAAYLGALTQVEIAREERERQAGVAASLEKLLANLAEWNKAESAPVNVAEAIPEELVGEWKARLLGAAAKLRLAEATHSREKSLFDKGISSSAEHESAHQEWEAAQADYAALVEEVLLNLHLDTLRAENTLRSAGAALMAAEHRLRILGLDDEALVVLGGAEGEEGFARLAVRAPRGGTIIAQDVSEGRVVEAEQPLCTIADLANVWVWCDLYERDLAAVQAAMATGERLAAAVQVAAFPGRVFPGSIDLVDSTVDAHTRTLKARVQVANPDGLLKPGMFVHVEVKIQGDKETLLVPRSALLSDGDERFVFEKGAGNLWLRRDVVPGAERGGMIEIESGLAPGAVVAASGGFMLKSDILREKMGAG